MSLPSGTRLGAYELVSVLGAGGMGKVYRARDVHGVDATDDLSRLLAAIPELADGARAMTAVLNWREAIGR